jgi:predicted transcriptional regulator
MEMLHFLSEKKMKLINAIRRQLDSITNIAKVTKRNRAAVYRVVSQIIY